MNFEEGIRQWDNIFEVFLAFLNPNNNEIILTVEIGDTSIIAIQVVGIAHVDA